MVEGHNKNRLRPNERRERRVERSEEKKKAPVGGEIVDTPLRGRDWVEARTKHQETMLEQTKKSLALLRTRERGLHGCEAGIGVEQR